MERWPPIRVLILLGAEIVHIRQLFTILFIIFSKSGWYIRGFNKAHSWCVLKWNPMRLWQSKITCLPSSSGTQRIDASFGAFLYRIFLMIINLDSLPCWTQLKMSLICKSLVWSCWISPGRQEKPLCSKPFSKVVD